MCQNFDCDCGRITEWLEQYEMDWLKSEQARFAAAGQNTVIKHRRRRIALYYCDGYFEFRGHGRMVWVDGKEC